MVWLVDKPVLFQRAADILLNYAASAWGDDEFNIAEGLIAFTGGDRDVEAFREEEKERRGEGEQRRLSRRALMLPLFIPFMQRLESQSPVFCSSMWELLAAHWNVEERMEVGEMVKERQFVEDLSH